MVSQQSEGSETITVLDPRGEVTSEETPIAPRLESINGITLGLLDNSKANADVLLWELAEILEDRYEIEDVVYRQKMRSSIPADDLAEQLYNQCDAVINAYGDCGSCTSWCVYDSIDLEKKGIPTATVNSDEFVKLGQSETRSLGMPGLPIVVVPHPMGDIPTEVAEERAAGIVDQVIDVLTRPYEELQEEYRGKFLGENEELSSSDLYCPI